MPIRANLAFPSVAVRVATAVLPLLGALTLSCERSESDGPATPETPPPRAPAEAASGATNPGSPGSPGPNGPTGARPPSSDFDLSMEATHTVIAWTKAGQPTPPGGTPGDIGPEFWLPRIREFHPLRAYSHRINLVLVTNRTGPSETGWYLHAAHSSFLPFSPGPIDAFLFPDIVVTPTGQIFSPDGPLRYQRRLPSSASPAPTPAP